MFEHEHVTLISNAAEGEGGDPPSLNKFRTKLASPLILDADEHEIGVQSIAFNYDWFNLESDGLIQIISLREPSSKTDRKVYAKSSVPHDHYATVEELVSAVNKSLIKAFSGYENPKFTVPRLVIGHKSRTLSLEGTPTIIAVWADKVFIDKAVTGHRETSIGIEFSSNLRNMLGFHDFESFNSNNGIIHPTINDCKLWEGGEVDIKNGIYQLCVYSNIIRHRRVGNHLTQLLRVVQLETEVPFEHRKSYTFNPIQYFPPRLSYISEIEIEIRDDVGRLIPFRKGRTTVELDIRRRIT